MAHTIDLKIGSATVESIVAAPEGKGPFPGIVVTFHRDGIDDFTHWLVDDLARNGFVAIAPDHFHVLPPDKGPDQRRDYLTDEQMAEDLRAAAGWLASQPNVAPKKYGLLGHCMGGRTTWVGLADSPELWACGGVWYGGGAFRTMGKVPAPFDRFSIIKAPVAGFFGKEDENPSQADVAKFDQELTKFGIPHEFHSYDDAAHAFMWFGTKKYREHATKDSWAKGMAFMKRHIGA
jgi:carboxymethylenebutenolidase